MNRQSRKGRRAGTRFKNSSKGRSISATFVSRGCPDVLTSENEVKWPSKRTLVELTEFPAC